MLAVILATLLAAPQASITTPPPAEATAAPEIEVTASRLSAAEIAARSQAYVESVLPTPTMGQYARFNAPVCIRVSGIDDAAAALVAARIRTAASAAGARMAGPRCRPNLTVAFSEDARTTVTTMLRREPRILGKTDLATRAALLDEPLPVRWWHGTAATDRSGKPATANSAALMSAQGVGGRPLVDVLPIGSDAVMTEGYNSSLINTNLVISVSSAVAIVDVTLATGKSLDAVADYVAMVTLAPMRLPPPVPAVPSILALFGDAPPPRGLSNWDRAYLAGLYQIPASRRAGQQRRQLAGAMAKAVSE